MTEEKRKIIADLPLEYIVSYWMNSLAYDDDVAFDICIGQLKRDNVYDIYIGDIDDGRF